jgi:hypothetical protein
MASRTPLPPANADGKPTRQGPHDGSRTHRLVIEEFAQIRRVDLEFGDLTVLVGAQATGKSLALQWLKLAVDELEIADALREAGFTLKTPGDAVDAYLGEGMHAAMRADTKITFDRRRIRPEALTRKRASKDARRRSMFLIPAHRALLLSEGWPAPFMKLGADTPMVARLFSQALYERLSKPRTTTVFPQERVLVKDIRDRIDASVFHGAQVRLQTQGLRRRLELSYGDVGLPFMTWTAGQREFAPLLLGLYSVLPERKERKVEDLEWVVVEEPEMGLHPRAIATVMILVLDLLWRGYRVVLSTHSPLVLDVVWALQQFKHPRANVKDLAKALGLKSRDAVTKLTAAVGKDFRVHYFRHDEQNKVTSKDISRLDPGSEDSAMSEWGGLTQFGTSLSEAVARIPEDET